MDKIEKLSVIWGDIPNALTDKIQLSQKEIIEEYVDLLKIGDCFFVIFNTHTAQIEYVSSDVEKIIGVTSEELSLQYLLNHIYPDDLPYFFHYEDSAVRFFGGLNTDDLYNYKFTYDYRFVCESGETKRLLQHTVPLYYFPTGGVRTIAVITDITHFNISGIPKLSFIGMNGAPSYYNVHLTKDFQLNKTLFTKREREILQFVLAGKKTEEIAQLLFRSHFTIQNHRKNILSKSGCRNIQELLVKSIREGWV